MSDVLRIQGAGYIDVCAIDGAWQAVYRQGADIVCLRDGLQRWFISGLDILQIRCANDDAGKVLAVGQHHVTGKLTLVHEGRFIEGDWGHAGGVNSCAVTFDGLRWHTWQMDTGTSSIHRVFQRDSLAQLFFDRVNISVQFPEGTSQGISYIQNGQPVFTDAHRELKNAQGNIVLTLPNPVTPFLSSLQEDTGDHLWIGQGGRGLAAFDAESNVLQTVAEVFAGEPHIARLGAQDFVACCRTLTDAVVVTFSVPLTQDIEQDLPVNPPGRPFFTGAFHHHYDEDRWPDFGDLVVPSTLDVVGDPIPPIRPSLIGPDAIRFAPNDQHLVQGLFVSAEDAGPDLVERQITLVRERWVNHHPGADIPPVVCYLTEAQRIMFGAQWANATSADIWAPECYLDLTFPADPALDMSRERFAWVGALGSRRPILPVCQAFDRNGVHAGVIDRIAHFLPVWLSEWAKHEQCLGLLFFDVNRSGMFRYSELARQFGRIASVCVPPAQLHPWLPISTPAPPRVAVRASATTVRVGDEVTFTVDLLPGSGPVHASVLWGVDRIGDSQDIHWIATGGFTFRPKFIEPGRSRVYARVTGPGGEDTSDEFDSPLITVLPKEEEMSFPNDQQQADFLAQLQAQGYIGFLGRPEGLFTSGSPEDLVSPLDENKRVDKIGLAVWQGRFNQFFATAPSNARPDVHNWAMRHALRQVHESEEAQNNPNRPPLPEHWNESFDGPPLLPSAR